METNPGSPELLTYICQQIANHGPVTFRWFMQQALYHPQYGYYGGGRARIGRKGDFYTNVSVGKIFGELLAKQFEEMWERMNQPVSFAIVEEGAHNGQFAHDVLTSIREKSPEFFQQVRYWIVEPNARLQQEQQATLSVWPRNKIRWTTSLDSFEAGSLCGVHFSNELLDAFPIHLVTFMEGQWRENFVDVGKQGFRYTYGPPSSSQLRAHLEKIPLPDLPAGSTYCTEINLGALRWVEDLSKVLGHGYILLADYGYPRDVYYLPERTEGTLTAYNNHQKSYNPLENVGLSDLTAHVDFTSLVERAESSGLQLAGYCDQHHFLVPLGEGELLKVERSLSGLSPEALHFIRRFKTLMHPSTMGMAFKFVCLSKSVSKNDQPLTGFSRCSDPRRALGLGELSAAVQEQNDDPYAAF